MTPPAHLTWNVLEQRHSRLNARSAQLNREYNAAEDGTPEKARVLAALVRLGDDRLALERDETRLAASAELADADQPDPNTLSGEQARSDQSESVRYPYRDGDVTVLGPEIFASEDGSVICWQGVNYFRGIAGAQPAFDEEQA